MRRLVSMNLRRIGSGSPNGLNGEFAKAFSWESAGEDPAPFPPLAAAAAAKMWFEKPDEFGRSPENPGKRRLPRGVKSKAAALAFAAAALADPVED